MIRELLPPDFPELLKEIPDAPEHLRYEGELPKKDNKLLAVVGSRKYSSYGRETCESLIAGLADSPVTIVSGLALGIDSIAHRAALRAGLQTIAIPGSGLDRKVLHPHSHVNLAEEIIENGGGLISEYDDTMPSGAWAFPRRNRIMAGMCHATLVIEAEKKSGTLITSRLVAYFRRSAYAHPSWSRAHSRS
ncbi:MAG: DNA-protecting protein DprA [Candidatus Zambryskibacteria bacterium]|nr:DNA-protecting protein DprA [Candidatus Zambryskibacteria bacterium]